VPDLRLLHQGLVPVGPDLDQPEGVLRVEGGQGPFVFGGVADHLAAAPGGLHGAQPRRRHRRLRRWHLQGREPVLEDHDLVGAGRDLCRLPAGPGWAEGAVIGWRFVGPILPVGGRDHPLLQERVPAELRHGLPPPRRPPRGRRSLSRETRSRSGSGRQAWSPGAGPGPRAVVGPQEWPGYLASHGMGPGTPGGRPTATARRFRSSPPPTAGGEPSPALDGPAPRWPPAPADPRAGGGPPPKEWAGLSPGPPPRTPPAH